MMSPEAQRWEEFHRSTGMWVNSLPRLGMTADRQAAAYVFREMMEGRCLACGAKAMRDEVHNGVGMVYGPWGCPECGWSEDPRHDLRRRSTPANVDQFGGLWPHRKGARRCDMAAAAFERLYMGTWESDPKEELAHKLLACYEFLTERYDRSVCTGGFLRGSAMPYDSYERTRINQYARECRKQLDAAALRLDVLPELERLRNAARSQRTYEDDKRTAEESGLLHHFGTNATLVKR